jgi:hypothetical protein
MKINRIDEGLIIKDNPIGFWFFYSCFILGGSIALFLSIAAGPDALTTLFGSAIGIGNIAGGIFMIKREPASIVEVDCNRCELRIKRWWIGGYNKNIYPLNNLSSAEVETNEHTEGGLVYRPRFHFKTIGFVPVSLFWYQTENESKSVVEAIQNILRGYLESPLINKHK